jgi:hypothetical protein
MLPDSARFADAFDVHVSPANRVKLLDINQAFEATQALIFTWKELRQLAADICQTCEQAEETLCAFRVVDSPLHIQTSAKSAYGAPLDTLDMHGMTWPDVFNVLEFERAAQEQSE